jgi:hypothetical protein
MSSHLFLPRNTECGTGAPGAAGSGQRLPPHAPDPAVGRAGGGVWPARPAAPRGQAAAAGAAAPALVFLCAINGPLTDRGAGPGCASSWLGGAPGADLAFRGRRDALARCASAALWARPGAAVSSSSSSSAAAAAAALPGALAVVYADRELWVLFSGEAGAAGVSRPAPSQASASQVLLQLGPDFARSLGARQPPTEERLLRRIDEAVRRARGCAGLTVHRGAGALAQQLRALLPAGGGGGGQDGRRHPPPPPPPVMLELHDALDAALPVYDTPRADTANTAAAGVGTTVVGLGCVEDCLDVLATATSTARGMGFAWATANIGPLTEFSSKVIHVIQAHHDAGRLGPAVARRVRACAGSAAGGGGGGGGGEEPISAAAAVAAAAAGGGGGWRPKARTPRGGGGLAGERRPISAPVTGAGGGGGAGAATSCDLHFWVWMEDRKLAEVLPSAAECATPNPTLRDYPAPRGEGGAAGGAAGGDHGGGGGGGMGAAAGGGCCRRARAWLLPNAALAAIAKSHGAYTRRDGVAVSCAALPSLAGQPWCLCCVMRGVRHLFLPLPPTTHTHTRHLVCGGAERRVWLIGYACVCACVRAGLLPPAAGRARARCGGWWVAVLLQGCKLSLVLGDTVLTFGASLVQRFVGARGWGALTEHHLLVAVRCLSVVRYAPPPSHGLLWWLLTRV